MRTGAYNQEDRCYKHQTRTKRNENDRLCFQDQRLPIKIKSILIEYFKKRRQNIDSLQSETVPKYSTASLTHDF